jgi:hypothetical protein
MSIGSFSKPLFVVLATSVTAIAATPAPAEAAATANFFYRQLSGYSLVNGACVTTTSLTPTQVINVLEIQLQGVEAPLLTFTPSYFYIESPNLAMPGGRSIGVTSMDGTKEWWKGYANEFNGAFDSGTWTIEIDEHPQGCSFYDNSTRLEIAY